MEAHRWHAVAVLDRVQVIGRAMEIGNLLAVELGGDRRGIDAVDPVVVLALGDHGRHLVIGRVGGGREEVLVQAGLVGVDEELRRVLPQQLELGVGLELAAREPVAVHVEAVEVAARADRPPVGVLDRQDHDHGVVADPAGHAVLTRGSPTAHREAETAKAHRG